jgi:hypothetical protein
MVNYTCNTVVIGKQESPRQEAKHVKELKTMSSLVKVNEYQSAYQSAQEELKAFGWVCRSGGDPYDSNSCWTIWVDPNYAHLISEDEYEIPDEIPDDKWVSL